MDNSPAEYTLADAERESLRGLHLETMTAKVVVFNLNAQLEEAVKAVAACEARWSGATRMLANAHGMQNAQLSPDFTKITRS